MGDMEMWSEDRRFGLILEDSLLRIALKECAESNSLETGGILVGYYTAVHDCAVVTRIGAVPQDSVRLRLSFQRGTHGIQAWIDRLWREKRHHYLGEWHFHSGGAPIPSSTDIEQMQKLSMDKKLSCPEPILFIIGGDPNTECTVAAFVYPVGRECVPLLPIQEVGRRKI